MLFDLRLAIANSLLSALLVDGVIGGVVAPFVITIGCAVPGIMASRTIRNERERRATAMLAPFMPCGAKVSDAKWTKIMDGMTIYTEAEIKALLEQAGFSQINEYRNEKKGWISFSTTKQ